MREIDMKEAMRPQFEAGDGVVLLQRDMPDAALLLAIKMAASFGKPFNVVPAIEFSSDELKEHSKNLGGIRG